MTTTTEHSPRNQAADRLHRRLDVLLRDAERHESRALAELAELRRAAGRTPAEAVKATPALIRIIGPALRDADGDPLSPAEAAPIIDDALLVASLVAFARPPIRRLFGRAEDGSEYRIVGSFGRDMAALRASMPRPSQDDGETVVDRLMRTILDAQREDLDGLLRRAFSLMGRGSDSGGAAVHVEALVRGLGGWNAESRRVQRRWAYDYWTTINRGDAASKTTTGDDA
jgi:CRISPR type I-E-associated protein CasB/Cse2